MNPKRQEEFIKEHLTHELTCLLEAAVVWEVFKKEDRGCEVSIAMDSAFLHARSLYIFFTSDKNEDANNATVTEFGVRKGYKSGRFGVWKVAINRHLFHLNRKRLEPQNLKKSGHLNEQVVILAREILNLWIQFESDPLTESFHAILRNGRLEAIRHAAKTTKGKIQPVFEA